MECRHGDGLPVDASGARGEPDRTPGRPIGPVERRTGVETRRDLRKDAGDPRAEVGGAHIDFRRHHRTVVPWPLTELPPPPAGEGWGGGARVWGQSKCLAEYFVHFA